MILSVNSPDETFARYFGKYFRLEDLRACDKSRLHNYNWPHADPVRHYHFYFFKRYFFLRKKKFWNAAIASGDRIRSTKT
jgi:hypothetical protein